DIDGLYTKHPNSPFAEFIDLVREIDDDIISMAQSGSKSGRGGMKTKILAADIASKCGSYVVITSVENAAVDQLILGETKCTLFLPAEKLPNKSIWLMYATNASGNVIIDEGAIKALKKGASLLLPGIGKVEGTFVEGDIVQISDKNGVAFAKGISNYSSKVINERLDQKKEGILPNKTFEVISHENMEFLY
ncbi:MAG: glutamate 5-kinase, partial [Candidatus Lokiarchaeota archaeon]|nr:glutamate 5-kinase [Candidatus Lokiarchaeota archaeon]